MDPALALPMLFAAAGVACLAGIVKGIVGFAMPMVIISGLGSFLPPEVALAGLILPTVVTNVIQVSRQGMRAAIASMLRIRTFLIMGFLTQATTSQFVLAIPQTVFFLVLGVPITIYAIAVLAGVPLTLKRTSTKVSAAMGALAGVLGGLSGIWGPPTVAYLTAYNLPKDDQMRAQGVVYGLGALVLLVAHSASGVLNAVTLPFSAMLIPPAVVGIWIGFRIQDRMDQALFKKATLVVLVVAGLNLIRRGLGY